MQLAAASSYWFSFPLVCDSYQAHGLAPLRRVHTLPPKLVERVFSGGLLVAQVAAL